MVPVGGLGFSIALCLSTLSLPLRLAAPEGQPLNLNGLYLGLPDFVVYSQLKASIWYNVGK